jgi:hypothetical protein
MKVVLLAHFLNDAKAYIQSANLPPRQYLVATSSAQANVRGLDGLRLTEDDLVCELPGFREGPNAQRVVDTLQMCIRFAEDAGPRWENIAGTRAT